MKATGTQEQFDFSNGYHIGGAPLSGHLRQRIHDKFLIRLERDWGGRSLLHGRTPGAGSVRLDGNDYLSITGHPDILQAQINALKGDRHQVVQASIFHLDQHPSRHLEQSLAAWIGHEDGMLCQSGYMANVGLLQSIADETTPVYIDSLAHTSLWEGAKAAKAPAYPFRHNDPEHLAKQMRRYGQGIVVVDSVYSTTGALCPLTRFVEVTEQYDSMIVVDESHSLGTHGPKGAGLCAQLGLTDRVHFITASLAKAFAGRAGFFTTSSGFRNYVLSECFPTIFSSALLTHEIAALQATLEVIKKADIERQRLQNNTHRLRTSLLAMGYPIAHGSEQILSLESGYEPDTMVLRDELEGRDVFGAVFCAPATSRNRAMVRLTLNSALTEAEMSHVEMAARAIVEKVKPWTWPIARRVGMVEHS